jgi:hypothetical protein
MVPESPFLGYFWNQKIVVKVTGPCFSEAANLTGLKLGAQGSTLDDLQAHSFSFVFISLSPWQLTVFRVVKFFVIHKFLVVGLPGRPSD